MIPRTVVLLALLAARVALAQEALTMRYDGFGPVSVGMSKTEAARALGVKLVRDEAPSEADCEYFRPASGFRGVHFMFIRGRLARIDATDKAIATEDGVRVGDPFSKIEVAYPMGFSVEPNPYIDWPQGKYVTVRTSDGKYAIRFALDRGRIMTYYAGRYAEIQYIEGCL